MSRQKNVIPGTFQAKIIARFLNEENFKDFAQQYADAHKRMHRIRPATPLDLKIYSDHRKGTIISELKEKYNVSANRIFGAIYRASRES